MKNLAMMSISSLFLCLALLSSCTPEQMSTDHSTGMKDKLEHLSGTYMDPSPYAYGEAWGHRIFTFDDGKWTLRFTLALAPDLSQPVFEFRTYGTYQVQQPSATVDNAYEALFLEEKKYLTLKTSHPQLIEAFGFSDCELMTDVEKDISETGCALWASVAECHEDYDLLSMDEDGVLYFGIRPVDNNMCTPERRPTALAPGVHKQ
jgi:hypothetical protein